jgi:hypothetical protein
MSALTGTPAAVPTTCPPWCAVRHAPFPLTSHGRRCVEFATGHGDVSVTLEQPGSRPARVVLSVHTPDAPTTEAGLTHLTVEQAYRLGRALVAAADVLTPAP